MIVRSPVPRDQAGIVRWAALGGTLMLLTLLLGCSTAGLVDAIKPDIPQDQQRRDALIGRWYSESVTKDGGRRLAIANRAVDGAMRLEFIRISPDGSRNEQIEVGLWGLSGHIYFSITMGVLQNDKFVPFNRTDSHVYDAYEILELTEDVFRYRHVSTGSEYRNQRVSESFQFPE